MAAARAALIEQERVVALDIEQRAVHVLRSASWPAVQEQNRRGAACPDLLDIQPMSVAHGEHAGINGAYRWRGHRVNQPCGRGCFLSGIQGSARIATRERSFWVGFTVICRSAYRH